MHWYEVVRLELLWSRNVIIYEGRKIVTVNFFYVSNGYFFFVSNGYHDRCVTDMAIQDLVCRTTGCV